MKILFWNRKGIHKVLSRILKIIKRLFIMFLSYRRGIRLTRNIEELIKGI